MIYPTYISISTCCTTIIILIVVAELIEGSIPQLHLCATKAEKTFICTFWCPCCCCCCCCCKVKIVSLRYARQTASLSIVFAESVHIMIPPTHFVTVVENQSFILTAGWGIVAFCVSKETRHIFNSLSHNPDFKDPLQKGI